MPRAATQASIKAAEYLAKHPETEASFLAKKFGLDRSSIYRMQWWKDNQKARVAAVEARNG